MDMVVIPPAPTVDKGSNVVPPPGIGTGGTVSAGWIVVAAAFASSLTLDCSAYSAYATIIFDTTLTGNVTTFAISNAADGQSIIWRAKQDGTGSRTWAPNSTIGFSTTIASVTLTTAINKLDYIAFRWSSTASKAHVTAYNLGF